MNSKNIYFPLFPNFSFNLRLIWSFIIKIFLIFNFLLIIFSLIFFIFQVNFLTRDVYISKSYEKKLSQLKEDNKNLEISFSKLNSLSNLGVYSTDREFEKITETEVKYIKLLTIPIAEK